MTAFFRRSARFLFSARFARILILAVPAILSAATTHSAKNEAVGPGNGALLSLDFDGRETDRLFARKLPGVTVTPNGHTGKALRLPGREHAEILQWPGLTGSAGTISFRVRPLWRKGDTASHTFLSLRWADERDSYLAVSHGWWEPVGSGRLYFILSNQENMHCSLPYKFDPDSWTHITVTWQGGRDGYCRLFLDGEKAAEHRAPFSGRYAPKGPLYLGSDTGGTDRRSRRSGFLLDDLIILDRARDEAEVLRSYEDSEPLPAEARRKKRRWLDALPAKGPDSPLPGHGGLAAETRVLFDEDIRWAVSRSATDEILSRLGRSGFNVYVPCVWHGRGTAYPTSRAHQDRRVAARIAAGDDPLAYLLKKAHAAGIEVHPWFTVARREDSRYPAFFNAAAPANAFDVHNGEFRKFIVGLMLDVVDRYPVDGINLDYIRTMGDCVCSDCLADYRKRFGRDLREDLERKRLKKEHSPGLETWHGEAVSEIVRDFSLRAKKRRPGLVVSVDAHPLHSDLSDQGQDSVAWEKNGWVDVVFAMDYGEKIDVDTLTRARAALRNPAALVPLLAVYDVRERDLVPRYERARITGAIGDRAVVARDPLLLADYIRLSRRLWPGSGIAFYHEKRMTDEQAGALGKGVFTGRAHPAWSAAPARGASAR